ncbi:DUF4124 domain-containing protein [Legionella sp. km772]|uniref:DUF4124 domain-containing protein n=1 Tax=Legionella sp. km772 TaxID=2498111 RepID=UPI000F8C5C59|nr:DUF4124 domain-containing protein [Legionella sp. km772]RUR08274.1 DUF4124 domain-containing protein [Legionella sp. km772]
MLRQLIAVFLSLITCAVPAQVYKWTDSQGVVHFSDTPHSGAETINNIQTQSYSTPAPTTSATMPAISNEGGKNKKVYSKIAILQPKDQATIRNNQGYVVVFTEVLPKLFPGNKLQIIFDGKAQGDPQESLMFQLNGIYRGTHTIAVQIVDENGDVIKTSPRVVIYMQRPRVGMVKHQAL